MRWAKVAAISNWLFAALAAFLAYGIVLGAGPQILPTWTPEQTTTLAAVLGVYSLAILLAGAFVYRQHPAAGYVAAMLHVGIIIGGVYMAELHGKDDVVRALPRILFHSIVVLVNIKAALALTSLRRRVVAR